MLDSIARWFAGLPTHTRVLLAFATTVVAIELLLRYAVPKSRLYALWTRGFTLLGEVWTAVLLSVIYLIAVGPVSLVMRLARRDLLDKQLASATSAWRNHDPNPLGPEAAARHQF